MLGHIESYDETYQTGIVKAEKDYYEFHLNQWTSEAAPSEGDDVEFSQEEGVITEVHLVGAYLIENQPVKTGMRTSPHRQDGGCFDGWRFGRGLLDQRLRRRELLQRDGWLGSGLFGGLSCCGLPDRLWLSGWLFRCDLCISHRGCAQG